MSIDKSNFAKRMKEYEFAFDYSLPIRMPIIVRLDGNSFSKVTKQLGYIKPFDGKFLGMMNYAAKKTLEYCQGEVAYVQSDEITILINNYKEINTEPLLANRIQKMTSLLAATCSVAFNFALKCVNPLSDLTPVFDCRVFVVPKEEVNNVFLWRQNDAFKNFVSSVAYWEVGKTNGLKKTFAELQNLNTAQKQEFIFQKIGVNVNDYPIQYKRGVCIFRQKYDELFENVVKPEIAERFPEKVGTKVARSKMIIDTEIPLFNKDRDYIGKYV